MRVYYLGWRSILNAQIVATISNDYYIWESVVNDRMHI